MRALFVITVGMICVPPVACGGGGEEADSAAVADTAAYTDSTAELLENGMDQDSVRNLLGEPRTRVTMEGGQERWTYYSYDPQGQIVARTMIIFGDDATVAEVFHGQR
jgi:outer membrane protein assembly factor BamE (lipoprotein component of BamABCDE complex)